MERLICIECCQLSDDHARHWEGYLVDLDDDGNEEAVFYCPSCSFREFGPRRGIAPCDEGRIDL